VTAAADDDEARQAVHHASARTKATERASAIMLLPSKLKAAMLATSFLVQYP
jgi:hypothetical protein